MPPRPPGGEGRAPPRPFETRLAATPLIDAAPEVHVVIDCIIGRREGRDVVATFVAAAAATAAANRLTDVVTAFEQATGTALAALSQQAAQAARADRERDPQNAARPAPSSSRQSQ